MAEGDDVARILDVCRGLEPVDRQHVHAFAISLLQTSRQGSRPETEQGSDPRPIAGEGRD